MNTKQIILLVLFSMAFGSTLTISLDKTDSQYHKMVGILNHAADKFDTMLDAVGPINSNIDPSQNTEPLKE